MLKLSTVFTLFNLPIRIDEDQNAGYENDVSMDNGLHNSP